MPHLPYEIWYMICTQLCNQGDSITLFNCACSGKQLATIALTNLYRMRHLAPVTDCCSDEEPPADDELGGMKYAARLAEEKRVLKRKLSSWEPYVKQWAVLWRTIILSSLGETLYPYAQYIRTLDLRDLELLLTDIRFEGRTREDFFPGELAQFRVDKTVDWPRYRWLNAINVINVIEEAITEQNPLLEEIDRKIHEEELFRWFPRLPRLTHLKLLDDAAAEGNGNLIRLHCPSFKGLGFRQWNETNSAQGLAAVLNELRPQSLESFEITSYNNFGPQSFQALCCQGESLIQLKLNMLPLDTIPQVSLLKCCTNLVSLSLGGRGLPDYFDLEEQYNDTFLETVAWLKECKQLRTLAFTHFPSANALMALMFLETDIHLISLRYVGEGFPDTEEYLLALANQTSLQFLCLKEEENVEMHDPEAAAVLVETLSKLVNLTDLDVSENFGILTDLHIMRLARSLPKLKVWSTNGCGLTDFIWGAVASLRSLWRLRFDAVTNFTVDGILDFIEKLGPGNKGLVLNVTNSQIRLSREEQKLIQEKIAKKVGGDFGITYNKYPHLDALSFVSESESD